MKEPKPEQIDVKVLTPLVHINGTGLPELLRGWSDLDHLLDAALFGVEKVEFNARDYYPRGEDAFEAARYEFMKGIAALKEFRRATRGVWLELQRYADRRQQRDLPPPANPQPERDIRV